MTDIFMSDLWDVRITDTSLRDGSHHKRHQFTAEDVRSIVVALDDAGFPVIEVEGAGDYLPPYAGNLDIMTAAATKVGEEIAKEMLSEPVGGTR